ncbi:TPA: glycosyltransferase family 4 protein [Vibrio vulnificus]|nr:glycosyltransferase family 4 protein [Vibrio vulnificus]
MISKKKRIIFFQPAVPEYRKDFFDRLSMIYSLEVYGSVKDFLGVSSFKDRDYVKLDDGFRQLPFGLYLTRTKLFSIKYSRDDLVVINGNPRILNYMLLFIFLKIKGVKTVWWGQGWTANSYGISAKIRLQLMKFADARLLYTDIEKEKILTPNTYALNNGLKLVDIPSVSNFDAKVWGDKIRLIFIGRITKKAKLNLVLDALSRLQDYKKFEFHVIGDGPKCEECKSLSTRLDLDAILVWHGSIFDEHKVSRIMEQVDYFIYPGSVGLSLIHAFNYALPAIIHNDSFAHMPEYAAFKDKHNGLSFSKDNVDSLTKVLERLPNLSKEDYLSMSHNARATVCETFNTADMASRFNLLVKEIS